MYYVNRLAWALRLSRVYGLLLLRHPWRCRGQLVTLLEVWGHTIKYSSKELYLDTWYAAELARIDVKYGLIGILHWVRRACFTLKRRAVARRIRRDINRAFKQKGL